MLFNIAAMFAVFWLIGWDLGVVEAVGMSLMVGLACDYVFHMAEAYMHTKEKCRPEQGNALTQRYVAMQLALRRMGVSIIGGAVTTVVSSSVLLLTTIQIFTKFGVIVSVTLALSLVYTLFFFTSFGMLIGPRNKFGDLVAEIKLLWLLVMRCCRKKTARMDDEGLTLGIELDPKPFSDQEDLPVMKNGVQRDAAGVALDSDGEI